MIELFTSLPHILYFGKLSCYAQSLWISISSKCKAISKIETPTKNDYNKLLSLIDESKQLLLYIEDIIKSISELADVISNALLYYAIYPLVMARLMKVNSYINTNTALMILTQIVTFITYKPLLNSILGPLVSREISLECKRAIEELPDNVGTYTKPWKFFESTNNLDCICFN